MIKAITMLHILIMIKQEHLSRKIRKRYQQNVDIVFLAISLVRAIVSQVMRLMD